MKEVLLWSEHTSQKKGIALKSMVFARGCPTETAARCLPGAVQKAVQNYLLSAF